MNEQKYSTPSEASMGGAILGGAAAKQMPSIAEWNDNLCNALTRVEQALTVLHGRLHPILLEREPDEKTTCTEVCILSPLAESLRNHVYDLESIERRIHRIIQCLEI